jgi:phosphohistidine phosphatase SixA
MNRGLPSRARRAACAALLPLGLLALLRPGAAVQDPPAELLEQLRYPKTVVLVRHAEKATDEPQDPALSEAGVRRAQELARVLGGAGVTHLYASEFRRTRETLEPLSLASGAAIQAVPAKDPRALASAIENLPRGSLSVVAGHSNTLPALLRLLAPDQDELALAESDYDRLWVVTLAGPRGPPVVLELRFGAP